MMDAHNVRQKEYLSTLFSAATEQGQHHHTNDTNATLPGMFSYTHNHSHLPQQPAPQENLQHSPLTIEMLGAMMQMQGLDSSQTGTTSATTSPAIAPVTFNTQTLLEQQFKLSQLQQLQQLQSQIFQQQIALISSQTTMVSPQHNSHTIAPPQQAEPHREVHIKNQYNGLPTPGPSAEIHAQQRSLDYVSPMILSNGSFPPQEQYSLDSHSQAHAHAPSSHHLLPNQQMTPNISSYVPRGVASAPEHIAFRHPSMPLSVDLDFDISPLASPWLGAVPHQPMQPSSSSSLGPTQNNANKRGASSSSDEGLAEPARKKQHSPAIQPISPNTGRKVFRGSRSTNSTPLLRSTRSRQGSVSIAIAGGETHGDTPSPVDLSMPPPAPPAPSLSSHTPESSASACPPGSSTDRTSPPAFSPPFTPVTPASIMNLGRLGVNHSSSSSNRNNMQRPIVPLKNDGKAKAPMTKPRTTSNDPPAPPPSSGARGKRKTVTTVSPNLKAILPAGTTSMSMSNFSSHQGIPPRTSTSPMSSMTPTSNAAPPLQVRKTSHKAAEQKRRDSLKTTFDELRLLLPPLPLPTDSGVTDEALPILPGALPPRGPPKAGGEGPNKGVSKLQLLMCGNEYIRVLKGRVDRRDEEITRLRREVKRLRTRLNGCYGSGDGGTGMGMLCEEEGEEEEEVDLEKDLDASEVVGGALGILRLGPALGGSASSSGDRVSGAASMVGDDEGEDDVGDE